VLLDALAAFMPESFGRLGFEGHDTDIFDVKPGVSERFQARVGAAIRELEALAAAERDPIVSQDIAILLKGAHDYARDAELEDKLKLPYESVHKRIFVGLHSLLGESVPVERRKAALVRIRRYAGLEPGFEPVVDLAAARTKERLDRAGLVGPVKAEVERDLREAETYVQGVRDLVAKYLDASATEPLRELEKQLARYTAFTREVVLPRARADFREPEEIYAFRLNRNGIALSPAELTTKARAAFEKTQQEMEALAREVAKQRGWPFGDYRQVLASLKKEQVGGDDILRLYQGRIAEVEAIIRKQNLVTLPERPMLFRIATPAETAEQPAPHVDQQGLFSRDKNVRLSFVLPLVAGTGGSSALRYDDFTFEAASWTLLAHEGRPGHDLQLSIVAERGLPLARTLFAFNSTNVEGWALYAEDIMRPFMPPDGRLVSLQLLLLREARAFLDPELQLGTIDLERARRVLEKDVVVSPAMATQELERYTFDNPGQAPSYFYGYQRILALRADLQQNLRDRYDPKRFHDVLLDQGLLPPDLLDAAVRAKLSVQ
jgi:uncharacterized protein (DUF885 family)